jgi:hypothetical protein
VGEIEECKDNGKPINGVNQKPIVRKPVFGHTHKPTGGGGSVASVTTPTPTSTNINCYASNSCPTYPAEQAARLATQAARVDAVGNYFFGHPSGYGYPGGFEIAGSVGGAAAGCFIANVPGCVAGFTAGNLGGRGADGAVLGYWAYSDIATAYSERRTNPTIISATFIPTPSPTQTPRYTPTYTPTPTPFYRP